MAPPELPPETEAELAMKTKIAALINELAAQNRQLNLNNAVRLAQQAAAGHGPLVEHFAELGRRYVETLSPPPKPRLTLVKGQRAHDAETGRGGAA